MKNLKKFLAIFLSIAMVMCSTLPSFASETETTIGASEETRMGEFHESEETVVDETDATVGDEPEEEYSRGERLSEHAEEETEESESDYAEEPEEDETSTGEFDEPEEDETSTGEFHEPEETVVDETEESVETSEDIIETSDETRMGELCEPEENVEPSSSNPEEESTETIEIATSSEITEINEELESDELETKVNDKLFGNTATPWMYYTVNGDKITFSSTTGDYGISVGPNQMIDYGGVTKNSIKYAVFDNEINAVTCNGLFLGFTNLESIEGLSRLNTSDVTSMNGMFAGCGKIDTDIYNVSNFDTSNVTNMSSMFSGCSSLSELDISNFDTSNVTSMSNMFKGCSSLAKITVTRKFVTNKVTDDGTDMFLDCTSLVGGAGTLYNSSYTNVEYARIDKESVSAMPGYFTSAYWMCWYLTDDEHTIHFSNLEPDGVSATRITTTISYDDIEYEGLRKNDITNAVFDNEINAVTCGSFFHGFNNLATINALSNLKTYNVKNMENMFYGCNKLENLDLSGFDTSNVTRMNNMFANCSSLSSLDLSGFNTSEVRRIDYMFHNCSSLSSLDLSNFVIPFELKNLDEMFSNCTSLRTLDLRLFDTRYVEDINKMFYECNNLVTIIASDNFVLGDHVSYIEMFYRCYNLIGCNGTVFNSTYDYKEYARIDSPTQEGYFSSAPWMYWYLTDSGKTMHLVDSKPSSGEYEVVSRIDEVVYYGLIKTDIKKVIFDNEINAVTGKSFFKDFIDLETIIDLSSLKTQNVETMEFMFSGCYKINSLYLNHFDTRRVKTMDAMFYECKNLFVLDLSNFDTSNVDIMEYMFFGCSSLEIIIATDSFDVNDVTYSDDMFKNCTKLVGGAGTTYDGNHTDKVYARIDGGTAAPGYFSSNDWMWLAYDDTEKELHLYGTEPETFDEVISGSGPIEYTRLPKGDVEKVTFESKVRARTCENMFYEFISLKEIVDIENLNTSSVISMNGMFSFCHTIYNIELNKFDTSRVTSMMGMFLSCSKIDNIDATAFDTSNVIDMSGMFSGCSNLTKLDLTKFDTKNVTNFIEFLNGCEKLPIIDLSSFDTSNVISMDYMFALCENLETITVSSKFVTTHATFNNDMFGRCNALKGGKGTTYDDAHKGIEYARIDGGPTSATPGYFTDINPPTPPAPYYPGGSSSSSGSGGGGGGGGPVTEDAPGVTYLPYVKSIIGFANNLMSKWSQDAMSSKWKLSVTAENGLDVPLKNGFVLYTHISTQIVGNTSVQTAANNTYVFDENGNMITGWVHTADGKTYFFENKKTSDEGKMIIGWKQIQGSWYCFGPDGEMYTNTVTPDGHPVGPDGKWRG